MNFPLIPRPLETETGNEPLVKKKESIAFFSEYSEKKAYPQIIVIRTLFFEDMI